MKFSCTFDDAVCAQQRLDALEKQGTVAWINITPDGKSQVFWMAS